MTIREYIVSDKNDCLKIFDSNRPKYFTESERQMFSDWLDKIEREAYYVLVNENQIVACGGLYRSINTKSAGLAWGMVDSNFHRQGYGRQLTIYRLEQLSKLYPGIEYKIETSQYTVDFYKKIGFETVSITPNGFGKGFDVYEMKK